MATVSTHLALPYLSFDQQSPLDRDDQNGGHIGTVGVLAEAIWEALESWNESDRLVLNLSLGWDGFLIGGLEAAVAGMPLAAQAVYRVLEEANCRGALVIAAAGNKAGDRQTPGPLLPAAWETRNPRSDCGGAGYQPLVYAVGGVGRDGRPLVNALPQSTPPLVAYGDHAGLASGFGDDNPTAILTGSSVSTLVVASTAAAFWAYNPDLNASEVMDQLYTSGNPLPSSPPPDFCLAGTPCPDSMDRPTVRQVSLCSTLHAAGVGTDCAPVEPLSIPTGDFINIGQFFLDEAEIHTSRNSHFDPFCEMAVEYDLIPPKSYPCPQQQFHDLEVQPWNHPQPRSAPCPSCTIRKPPPTDKAGGSTVQANCEVDLYIEISPEYPGLLENPTLVACHRTFNLDALGQFTRDESCDIPIHDAGSVTISKFPCNCDDVTLAFTVDKDCDGTPEGVANSPVLIVQ